MIQQDCMYVVTNREVKKQGGETIFTSRFNKKAPDELRLLDAQRDGDKWKLQLHEEPSKNDATSLLPSEKLFLELQERMYKKKRNCVFFVHGYNVNFNDALNSAERLEKLYNVEVIVFSWPSVGGGNDANTNAVESIYGTANYLRDKRIAINSVAALDRCFEKLSAYYTKYFVLPAEAAGGPEACPPCNQRFTLLCHSMGNYLLKKLMNSRVYNNETVLFDNIVLAAADTNSLDHVQWVDQIAHRRRIYITINENDFALGASRLKFGSEQLARLGHYTRNLDSRIAIYLDFTGGKFVTKSHSYFSDETPRRNPRVKKIFKAILNGKRGERDLPQYDPQRNVYEIG